MRWPGFVQEACRKKKKHSTVITKLVKTAQALKSTNKKVM